MLLSQFIIFLFRWSLIFTGLYAYDDYGLVVSFMFLAVATLLKPVNLEDLINELMSNKYHQIMALCYYLIVMFYVFLNYEMAAKSSGIVFVTVIAAPLIFTMLFTEFYSCFEKKTGK